jgi:molybdate transport system permease protein
VTGYVLLYLLGAQSPLGEVMHALWGETLVFTQTASVLAAAVVAFPLMYKTAKGAFEQIDPLSLDAAITLGAGRWHLFRTIGWSQALPSLAGGLTMAFGRAIGEFGATLVVGGNIEGRTTTIPIAIYGAIETGDMTKAGMWSVVLGALSIAAAVISQYSLRRG